MELFNVSETNHLFKFDYKDFYNKPQGV